MSIFNNLADKYSNSTAVMTENGISVSYVELENYSIQLEKSIPKRTLVFCLCKNTLGSFCG